MDSRAAKDKNKDDDSVSDASDTESGTEELDKSGKLDVNLAADDIMRIKILKLMARSENLHHVFLEIKIKMMILLLKNQLLKAEKMVIMTTMITRREKITLRASEQKLKEKAMMMILRMLK